MNFALQFYCWNLGIAKNLKFEVTSSRNFVTAAAPWSVRARKTCEGQSYGQKKTKKKGGTLVCKIKVLYGIVNMNMYNNPNNIAAARWHKIEMFK